MKEEINAVFCYLANGGIVNYVLLFKSLFLLNANFLKKNKYDVVVFHEVNYSKLVRSVFVFLFAVEFREINLLKHYLENINQISIDVELKSFSIGYRSMCHFFFAELHKHLKGYDYCCRLDIDSFLISPISFDPFKYMDENKLLYGYIAEQQEPARVINGLDKFLQEYLADSDQGNRNRFFFSGSKENLRCIYNNFEIINLNIFDNSKVKIFIDRVVKTNNIFNYRWGDAPLRTILILMFLSRDEIVRFKRIDYRHHWFVQKKGCILSNHLSGKGFFSTSIAGVVY